MDRKTGPAVLALAIQALACSRENNPTGPICHPAADARRLAVIW